MENNYGYKSFDKNFETFNGMKMEENHIYKLEGTIKKKEYGYHFAKRLEDALGFVDGLEEEVIICRIQALGKIIWYDDEHFGYDDLACTDQIYIHNALSRKEIFDYASKLPEIRLIRFLKNYKLTQEELNYFKEKYQNNFNIMTNIKYYQEKDHEAFNFYKLIKKK